MKILHTCEFYWPHVGGAEEVVRAVSECLVSRGHEVTVATRKLPARSAVEHNGVKIREFDVSGDLALGFHGNVNTYLDFLRTADVDVMMNYALQQWSSDLALLLLPDLHYATVGATCGLSGLYDPDYAGYFRQLPHMLRHYDRLIFHSSAYRDAQFARQHGIGHWHVVANAVHREEFATEPPPGLRNRLGVPDDHLLLLMVGNHTGAKGHRHVLDLFMRAAISPATLLIIGKNIVNPYVPLEQEFAAQVSRVTCTSRGQKKVIFASLPRADVVAAYFAADVFVFLSEIECSPLVLFEAAASGTPFLASDAGNSAEIAEWTGAGILVPSSLSDRGLTVPNISAAVPLLEKLCHDRELRHRMGENGRKRVLEKYTWDRIVDRYEQIYEEAVREKRARLGEGKIYT